MVVVYLNGGPKNKGHNRKGKLRKAGFDETELSVQHRLTINERYWTTAEEALDQVEVTTSRDVPKLPYLESLGQIELPPKVYDQLDMMEVTRPTPIQKVVIPYLLDNINKSDMLVQAQTGSGKTYAFLLPIIRQVLEIKYTLNEYKPNTNSPYAVIISPTRELAFQLAEDAELITQHIPRVKTSFAIGGVHMQDSKRKLIEGCDVLLITPGRLHHYTHSGPNQSTLVNTQNLKFVVLDEADKLKENRYCSRVSEGDEGENLDYDRLPPMDTIVQKFIYDLTEKKNDFRVVAFSATLQNQFLYKLVTGHNLVEVKVGPKASPATIEQKFVQIGHEGEKIEMLLIFLEACTERYLEENPEKRRISTYKPVPKMVIFLNEIRQTERLIHILVDKGYLARVVNSDRSGEQRYEAMKAIRRNEADILIATDVVARGLNISRLEYVVNYDLPKKHNFHEYIHRIGRCGRIGHYGKAISFFFPEKDSAIANGLIESCEAVGQLVPEFIRQHAYRAPPNYYTDPKKKKYTRDVECDSGYGSPRTNFGTSGSSAATRTTFNQS